ISTSGDVTVVSGHVLVRNTDNTARQVRLYEPSGAGTDYTAFQAQAQTDNITYLLPATIGSANQVLAIESVSGNTATLTWVTPSVSITEADPQVHDAAFNGGGTGRVAFWDDVNDRLIGDEELFWDNANKRLGIGTSSPQSKLHVHSSSIRVTSGGTGNTANDGFVIEQVSGNHVQLRQNENAEIQFRTNAGGGTDTVKMRLTAGGQLWFYSEANGAQYRIDLPNHVSIGVGIARSRGWVVHSSIRWKEDIRTIENALDKVLRMRGAAFRWKPPYGGNQDIGFIAEELWQVLPEVVQRDERTGEYLGVEYARVVPVLVEALKEEHRRTEELRAEVAQLRELVEQLLRERGSRGGETGGGVQIHDAWLGQNIPNPFEGTTTIPYYIPAGVGRAELVVRDRMGQELRRVELPERGAHGQVTLEMRLLGAGVYEYSLVLDGRVVATKQMTLVR
ncbi:MAG: tail fiber domain-containing protein, partial [Candidatus Kapabacteria bacterium]|nr:tail fiber domain-containing protein [Candidatus Kapabacteria bacterium]